jgi:uncharacterized protein DUF6627
MTRLLRNTLCRLLIALVAWAPFHMASAAMIGTGEATASTAQQDRVRVLGMLQRSEVATQLQAAGVDAAQAKDRIQAMSDEEVGALAQRIDTLPAGGLHGWGSLLVIAIIAGVVWWVATQPRR